MNIIKLTDFYISISFFSAVDISVCNSTVYITQRCTIFIVVNHSV